MAESATDTAYRIVESTRQNPWPALMIGAGVAWLLFDRTRDAGRFDNREYPTRSQDAGYETRRRRLGAARTTSDADEWMREGGNGGVRAYGEEIRNTARRAQSGLRRTVHENPLLVAAAAVLTGAAIGGALPQTEKENELMGEARDRVVVRAQDAAREAAESVKEITDPSQH